MDLSSYCGECQHQWAGPGIVDGKLECPRCGAVWEPETGKVTPGPRTPKEEE
jgi:nitrite reductase/ring-hydroxylating ferredoxin subunit